MKTIEYDKLTIYEVEDLHKKFLKYIKKAEGDLTLDLGLIQKIDMSGIQLLLSTNKTCKEKSINFNLANVSDSIKETIKLSGCDSALGVTND